MPSHRTPQTTAARTIGLLAPLWLAACYGPEATSVEEDASSRSPGSTSSTSGTSSSTTPQDTSSSSDESTTSTTADESSTSSDASTSTGEPSSCLGNDAGFGEPTPLGGVNTDAGELRPWLSEDELVLYFASNRAGGPGGMDLFVASREEIGAVFDEPLLLSIATDAEETSPALTADGLTLYFTSDYHTHVASRDSLVAEFGTPAAVAGINGVAGDYHPWVSAEGDLLYFNSERTGDSEIFVTERRPGGGFVEPVAVGALNTEATEDFPVLSSDRLTIFFGSTRPGGVGGPDIWMATRSTVDDGFGEPMKVEELNTSDQDHPSWLSPDGCRLYLMRVVDGSRDLFVAER